MKPMKELTLMLLFFLKIFVATDEAWFDARFLTFLIWSEDINSLLK